MNKVDTEYFRIVNDILTNGRLKKNRTGVDTIGIFGAQAKYNVDLNAFPLLTTKKVHWPAIVHELLWFISGDTNIKYLVDNNVRIWNEWAYKKYTDTCISKIPDNELESLSVPSGMSLSDVDHLPMDMFIERIKNDVEFATKWGELGEGTYGGMWRAFPYFDNSDPMCHNPKTTDPTAPLDVHYETSSGYACEVGHVDQLQKVINKLKTNPDDRRMIVSAWHPYWIDHCALPPCHCLFHFHTEELTLEERIDILQKQVGPVNLPKFEMWIIQKLNEENIPHRRLNCLLYQRSNDFFLGVPFNIASYSLLTAMIAHVTNMVPGTFTHSHGDAHVYVNHLDQIKLQMSREPKSLPSLWLNPDVKSLFDFKFDDIKLLNYDPHPTIKAEVAV
jgi:thymidylate synthase